MLIHSIECADHAVKNIGQCPGFHIAVIRGDTDVAENSEHSDVFPQSAPVHALHHERSAVKTMGSAVTADAPFDE
ncbi:hypothetical protein SDC9_119853 [bioreactor metagenome]|uniref:Uncharacterized protein n=1 Tax=bioreactor metagenome TaxID=1076179 RepID=A0A645C6U0_9ZZZZ